MDSAGDWIALCEEANYCSFGDEHSAATANNVVIAAKERQWRRQEEEDEEGRIMYAAAASSTSAAAAAAQVLVSAAAYRSSSASSSSGGVPPYSSASGEPVCAVCGDGHAKLHYGVTACYGCKGFFRRTLTGKYRYVCRFSSNCTVDKFQRNSCRYCRFNRCLEVGMDPKAVRPDRDLTGKQKVPRVRRKQLDEELLNHMVRYVQRTSRDSPMQMRLQGDEWSRKLAPDVRLLLMQLMNIETKVMKGDMVADGSRSKQQAQQQQQHHPMDDDDFEDDMGEDEDEMMMRSEDVKLCPSQARQRCVKSSSSSSTSSSSSASLRSPPPPSSLLLSNSKLTSTSTASSLREMFEHSKPILGRTEMSYEPYRMARVDELSVIAHRRAIAAVDWVDSLAAIADIHDPDDKVALVKWCYAPLTIFNFSARTAQHTRNPDILCLCNLVFVPRQLPPEFNESVHLSSPLIDRTLNELVGPLRRLGLREQEIVPLKAILILDPNARGLSLGARSKVAELRERVQDLLFHVCRELHAAFAASSRFGSLLLLLPTIATLSGLMSENVQMWAALGSGRGRGGPDPLVAEMFDNFQLDDVSSSISPPLFENPADICLEGISPSTEPPSTANTEEAESPRRTGGGGVMIERSTQTEQAAGLHQHHHHHHQDDDESEHDAMRLMLSDVELASFDPEVSSALLAGAQHDDLLSYIH